MEIQSAMSIGLQGLQKAQEDANQAAAKIAVNLNVSPDELGLTQEDNITPANQNAGADAVPDLNQSIVDLKVAEFQAKASAQVIQTADETLGTLLDVRA